MHNGSCDFFILLHSYSWLKGDNNSKFPPGIHSIVRMNRKVSGWKVCEYHQYRLFFEGGLWANWAGDKYVIYLIRGVQQLTDPQTPEMKKLVPSYPIVSPVLPHGVGRN